MARQKGAFCYGDDVEEELEKIIHQRPMTCNAATNGMRERNHRNMDRSTVKRMLFSLQHQKKIDNFVVGKVTLWSEKILARNIKQNLSGK